LIQQRVIGEGQGLFVLMQEGVPLGMFAHRRLRERPPSGGVSVLRESIALPKPMVEATLKLLQRVKWHGVAMVGKSETLPENGYRVGVKSRWLLGDLDQLVMRLTKSDRALNLPLGAPSKIRSLVSFCRFFERDLFYEVEDLDDFGPSLLEVLRYVRLA
jgi:hypothetical protein